MMNFITPHAILLVKENFREINQITGAQFEYLEENLEDSAEMHMPFYVVGWRDLKTGLPNHRVFTEVELAIEYRLDKIKSQTKTAFTKL